jgi:hypothetical protein
LLPKGDPRRDDPEYIVTACCRALEFGLDVGDGFSKLIENDTGREAWVSG